MGKFFNSPEDLQALSHERRIIRIKLGNFSPLLQMRLVWSSAFGKKIF